SRSQRMNEVTKSQEVQVHTIRALLGRLIPALALITLALPLATSPLATPAAAQISPTPPFSVAGVGSVAPGEAFNPLGTSHTVTFTCSSPTSGIFLTATAGTAVAFAGPGGAPVTGCFNVASAANDASVGAGT